MATQDKVRAMLRTYGKNYGKPDRWAEDSFALWFSSLKDYTDHDVSRVGREIMAKRHRMPTVAAFLEVLRGDPLTKRPEAAQGCGACSGSGWREISWHRWDRSRLVVTSYAAGCDCPKGRRIAEGSAGSWSDVVERFAADPSTEAVYSTSAQHPALTMAERYHPDVVARLQKRAE
tara:strand:+ start:430 stop:954 length:525 start_codon:yes stop_codon:yes gene_type:complete